MFLFIGLLYIAQFFLRVDSELEANLSIEATYSQFNVPLHNGEMIFNCTFNQPIDEITKPSIHLTLPDAKPQDIACTTKRDNVCQYRTPTKDLKFGQYKCQWRSASPPHTKQLSNDSYEHGFRVCDLNTACDTCNEAAPWCFYYAMGSRMDQSQIGCFYTIPEHIQCPIGHYTWCPLDVKTICEAGTHDNWDRMLARFNTIIKCPADEPYMWYDGRKWPFNRAIQVNEAVTEFRVHIPQQVEGYEFSFATYTLVNLHRNASGGSINRSGDHSISIREFLEIAKEMDMVEFSLRAVYSKRDRTNVTADLKNYFMYLHNEPTVSLGIQGENGQVSVFCETTSNASGHRHEHFENQLQHVAWWTVRGEKHGRLVIVDLTKDKPEDVVCHVMSIYKSCMPVYQMVSYKNLSVADSNLTLNFMWELPMNSSKPYGAKVDGHAYEDDSQGKNAGGLSTNAIGLIVGGVIATLVIGALIVFGVFYWIKRRRVNKHARNAALQATYKDESNVMDLAQVRKLANDVAASPVIAAALASSIAEETTAPSAGAASELIIVQDCSHPEIPLRTSSRVVCPSESSTVSKPIHMSKMLDYYGQPLLIGQNPKKNEFEKYLACIWKERVGTVIVAHGAAETQWQPCFSSRDGAKMKFGKFVTLTETALKSPGEFDQYAVQLSLKRKRLRTLKRHITFILVETPVDSSKAVELIEITQESQEKRHGQHSPAVLFQCPTGVHHSAAISSGFIGSQMWSQHKRLNVIGLLRYVRRNRYGVFSSKDNAGLAALRLLLGVIQIIATGSEMGIVGGFNVEAHERDVFDEKARQKELADVSPVSVRRKSLITANA